MTDGLLENPLGPSICIFLSFSFSGPSLFPAGASLGSPKTFSLITPYIAKAHPIMPAAESITDLLYCACCSSLVRDILDKCERFLSPEDVGRWRLLLEEK
jgi:hypothetical protein